MKYVPWVVLGAVSASAVGCGVLVRAILRPKRALAFKDYGTPEEQGMPSTTVKLPGDVHGWFAEAAESEVAVLLVHGRSRASGWMYPIARRLYPHASVMAIDLPGHGGSPGTYCSYGFRESEAVSSAVRWLEEHQSRPIVVIGVSMGGASTLIAQDEHPSSRVAAVVTIGTYADIASVFRRIAQERYLPWPLARALASVAGKIGGFDLQHRRPVDAAGRINVPYLAIQGDQDELVPTSAALRLAAAAPIGLARAAYYHGEHDDPGHGEMLDILEGFLKERPWAAPPAH